MSRGFIFRQILAMGASFFLCVSGALAADTPAAEPSDNGETCEVLADKAIEALRTSGVLNGAPLCTEDSCQAVSEVTDAITKLGGIADKITDATKKADFKKLITSISDAKEKILGTFPSPLPPFDPNGEGQKALTKVQAVKILCTAMQAALTATMNDAATNVIAQAKINVCRDKSRRLPSFLARYYGVAGSVAGGGSILEITHARYGDIFDEDLDYRRSLVDKIGGYPETGYPIDAAVPRAGKVFSEPELDNVSEPPWGRHRHTCDVTFKIRSVCAQRGCKSGVCSGDAYCIAGVGAADPTGNAPFAGCGYDPAPWYPKKSLQIEFTCDGRTPPERLIYPGNTASISLICSEPPTDMTAERDYFANEPCKIDLPEPAPVAAANIETDKKADSQKSDTDKKVAAKPDAPTPAPAPAPANGEPGSHQ